ncbi:phospholipase D-like domain-containing protein [Alkalihalobacterium alkalinitrilicum]|uniref:phospholipase D-like domain-containing protein n=1 Tax=Alkalihalobacterium alkalinitrilicum TaxID=427920 RepID=UPI000995B413|nr:phospholipase D family protein [Alkalihalobacterium alkalinitrilicum]
MFAKFLSLLLFFYVLYAFLFGVIIFHFHQPSTSHYLNDLDIYRFYSESLSQDRVVLVEDRVESGIARINLIENAQHTLDISYHTLHSGMASDIFFSSLVVATDRGVHIRILLDGMFHNLRGSLKEILYAFSSHPNIELKLYEPFEPLQPWTWNNRLHDKLILVDNELAMIGGRNIGDKYFAPKGYVGASNDRDLVIINTNTNQPVGSVIFDMKIYFDTVWNHEYSENSVRDLSKKQQEKGLKMLLNLRQQLESYQDRYPEIFQRNIQWINQSIPTNYISFIHNPIKRMNKEPWVWFELITLAEHAEQSIWIQSPYLIPTNEMMHFDRNNLRAAEINMITNSLAATNNKMAYSGYIWYRDSIAANQDVQLYEYQGPTEQLHTKTYVFDNRISMVGSFNLDPRSTFLSTESMVVIDSEPLATMLIDKIKKDIKYNSLMVAHDGTYHPSALVEAEEVSKLKTILIRVISIPMRFFQFML